MSKSLYPSDEVAYAQLLSVATVEENAVVTKPLYEQGPVRLVLFAMDAEQVLSDHSAPMAALVHVLDGRLAFTVAGQEQELTANDWLSMPAGEVHSVRAIEPTRFLLTLIKGVMS